MRRGVPVLTTADVGIAEIVRGAGAGLVVDPTPAAIAQGLGILLADAQRSRAMGETGRTLVVEQYGWPAIAGRMEALYRSLGSIPGGTGATRT